MVDFEDVLEEVGSWGPFQKWLLFSYGMSVATVASVPGMVLLFMTMAPDHQCHIPPLFDGSLSKENSECRISVVVHSNLTKEVGCLYGWQYDKTYFDYTAATKWDMVCENGHYASLLLTLQNVGSLIGGTVYGALADRFGRKLICFGLLLLSSVTDILSVLVNSLLVFCVLRTINGSVIPTIYNIPYILISEFMAPEKRLLVNVVFNCGWMTGMCILPLAAYLARNYFFLGIFSATCTAVVLLYWKCVPESASWLVSRERWAEATDVMVLIGQRNGKTVQKKCIESQLKEVNRKARDEKMADENIGFFSALLKYPRLRKHFLILTCSWMANTMAYLGFQYNVVHLAGNVFLNYFLLSLVEAPGNCLFFFSMDRLGRRFSATIGFLMVTFCCFLPLTGVCLIASILSSFLPETLGENLPQTYQDAESFAKNQRFFSLNRQKKMTSVYTIEVKDPNILYSVRL